MFWLDLAWLSAQGLTCTEYGYCIMFNRYST